MDIAGFLGKWEEMGNSLKDYFDDNNDYVIEFIDKLGNVEGYIINSYKGFRLKIPKVMLQLNNK